MEREVSVLEVSFKLYAILLEFVASNAELKRPRPRGHQVGVA